MTKQVTITLSDGTPYTGTLDPDGFLLLPRGAKPAEPWRSKCQAQFGRCNNLPDCANEWLPCSAWHWDEPAWFRIRPLPNHTWESIAAQQPATRQQPTFRMVCGPCIVDSDQPQQRDYRDWQEGLGDSAKPEDYDQQPGKYEVEYRWASVDDWAPGTTFRWYPKCNYRVRLRRPARDYTDWVEGVGDNAKPPDFDTNPTRYEVQFMDFNTWWKAECPFLSKRYTYRVRIRQQEVPLCSTDVSWAQPRLETDAEFALRFLVANTQRVTITNKDGYWASTGGSDLKVGHRDALRLSIIIAQARQPEAKP